MAQKRRLKKSGHKTKSGGIIPDYIVNEFHGLFTATKNIKEIPKGGAADSLNWITGDNEDHIELRRGMQLLGTTRNSGNGKITGLVTGKQYGGTEIPFFTYAQKIKYYDTTTDNTIEIGSNQLPAAAKGEDVAMDIYQSLAGSFVYLSSINSSIYKIAVANPGSITDLSSTTYRGFFRIKQNRMFLFNRKDNNGNQDQQSLYGSYIDHSQLSQYTNVTGESVGTGDGTTKTFTGTLAFKAAGAKRTCFDIYSFTDTVEKFHDDRNGNLVGDRGGTGTINYTTGAYSATFNTAPANGQALTTAYYWEDATNAGIADFTFTSPTRTAGQGFIQPQYDGGANFQNLFSIGGDEYCFHMYKVWVFTTTSDDTKATNVAYRGKLGIPYFLAAQDRSSAEIIYIDTLNSPKDPKVRLLNFVTTGSVVVPKTISDKIDLSGNAFDYALLFEFGQYNLLSCQEIIGGTKKTFNGVTYVYNEKNHAWDKTDYQASRFSLYNGNLIMGSSIQNNVFTVFSGFDDDGQAINNFWTSGQTNLGADGIKRFYRFIIDGLIQPNQSFDIYISLDSGAFVKIGTISGTGSYVDRGQAVAIGANTLGTATIGGSFNQGDDIAYHFRRELTYVSDIFENIQTKFVATKIGFAQINMYGYKDIRVKGRITATQYIG